MQDASTAVRRFAKTLCFIAVFLTASVRETCLCAQQPNSGSYSQGSDRNRINAPVYRMAAAQDAVTNAIDFLVEPGQLSSTINRIKKFRDTHNLNFQLEASNRAGQEKVGTFNISTKDEKEVLKAIQQFAFANGLQCQVNGNLYEFFLPGELAKKPEEIPQPPSVNQLQKLENEINDAFPDSVVRLTRVGKQVLLRGQAHDVVEANRILKLVSAEVQGRRTEQVGTTTRQKTTGTTNPIGINLPGFGTDINLESETISQPNFIEDEAPDVIDMLSVNGEQQVTLRVVVAEVNRNAARSIGLNFGVNNDAGTPIFRNFTGGLMRQPNGALIGGNGLVNAGANLPVLLDNGQIQLAINALRTMSLSKTLAEPTLTAMNGEDASFHAGGQFAVPVVGGANATNLQGVTYVPFGVQLQFTPFITDRDRIRLVVGAEVSARDASLTTQVGGDSSQGGTAVSGLNRRKFQTTVELREGQTLAVAGLIQSNSESKGNRVPFFGDLPLIGRALSNDSTLSGEQELVILITPELSHPMPAGTNLPLPGSDIFEPDDIEFYLGGHLESHRGNDYRSVIRTDIKRQHQYYADQNPYLIGPSGYSDCP